jgi:hypothetical protein
MIDKKTFKNTVLLIVELAGENGIGAVKLDKCLIICDSLHKALFGESLTGATYIKHKYGPVPGKEPYNIIQEMIKSGDIEVFDEMIAPDIHENNHYLCPGLKAPRHTFSDEEINIISWVVSTIMPMSAQQISEISHTHYYHNTPMFNEINLDEICKWKISDDKDTENNFTGEIPNIDFNELNNIIQRNQATAN